VRINWRYYYKYLNIKGKQVRKFMQSVKYHDSFSSLHGLETYYSLYAVPIMDTCSTLGRIYGRYKLSEAPVYLFGCLELK